MEFSQALHEALIDDITASLRDLTGVCDRLIPAAHTAVDRWYLPPEAKDAVLWLAHTAVEAGRWLLDLYTDLLRGALAPIFMFYDAYRWTDIRGAATGAASALSDTTLTVDDSDWSGRAHDAYLDAATAQAGAAAQIGAIASETAGRLAICAAAGTAFYAGLAVALAKFVASAYTALAALGTGVFSWVGLVLIIENAGFTAAFVGTAVIALSVFLAAQTEAMVHLHGQAVDSTAFPNGRWPTPNTTTYDDATVTDGDADWSLAP